jgi:hypothetical protein
MEDTSTAGGAPADTSAPQLTADEAKAKGDDLVRQSVKAEDTFEARRLSGEAEKFYRIATGGKMAGAKEVPADRATQQAPALQSPAADGKPMDRAQGETILHDLTGGAFTYDQLELVCRDAGPWARELELTLADKGQSAYREAIHKSEDQVRRDLYSGDETAMLAGCAKIFDAIKATCGERAPAVIAALDENFTLANTKAHEQLLTWARATKR